VWPKLTRSADGPWGARGGGRSEAGLKRAAEVARTSALIEGVEGQSNAAEPAGLVTLSMLGAHNGQVAWSDLQANTTVMYLRSCDSAARRKAAGRYARRHLSAKVRCAEEFKLVSKKANLRGKDHSIPTHPRRLLLKSLPLISLFRLRNLACSQI
jgi:hypothetical protein